MTAVLRRLLTISLAWLTFSAHADVTLRPNEKPKQTTRDFEKDQKKNGFPAPEPVDGNASFITGQSVQIELRVATAYLGLLKFMIREQPKYGTLSEIRPSPSGESNRAVVTYTHNAASEQLFDQFTFAARIGDGAASAPGTVTLIGTKPMPRLDIVSQPRFNAMQPGDSASATFVVMNVGNAPFSGDITISEPFTGPKHLDLAVNEKLSVLVMAKPMAPGAYHLDVQLQPGMPSSRVHGLVECAQAFVVTPGAVLLTYDPDSGERRGTIKVANGSPSPIALQVECGARLRVPRNLSLDGKGSTELTITLPKDDVAAFRGEVLVSQEPSRQKVLVSADPKPALIRLVGPTGGKIDFGSIIKGKKAEATVTIINDGGVPAVLQGSSVPPFFIATDLPKVKAEPGKQEEIVISFAPELPGTYTQTIVIGGSAGKIELSLRGAMTDPTRPTVGGTPGASGVSPVRPREVDSRPSRPTTASTPTPAPAPSAIPSPAPPIPSARVPKAENPAPVPAIKQPAATVAADVSPPSAPAAETEPHLSKLPKGTQSAYSQLMNVGISPTQLPNFQSQSIDPVPKIGVMERGTDYLTLMWEDPKVAPSKYMIETSYLVKNPATGLLLKAWRPLEPWTAVKGPQTGISAGRIDGLEPEVVYEMRVVGIDHDGKFSKPSDIIQVATASPFRMPMWIWSVLAFVILLAVAYKGYQVKQGEWQT